MAKKKPRYPYEYDLKIRKKAKAYTRIKIISGIVNGMVIPILFLLGFFLLGYSFQLKDMIGEGLLTIPVYILAILVILSLIKLPLKFYSGHIYEHKYGLSRMNKSSWFKEYFKGLGVDYVFTVPVLTLVYFLLGFEYWWMYAAVLYFFLDIFMDTIYPVVILPFFYKLTPFNNAKLKKKLLKMSRKAGAPEIKDVLVAKESDKSVKANAMFAGIGKTKRMVLFDTLLQQFTADEVETVIGHELGHYVHKHIWKGIALGTVLLFPTFYAVHLILSATPGLSSVGDIAGLAVFLVSMELIGIVLMPVESWFSRRMETQADWFGLEMSRKPEAQISTEKRLADIALSDVDPPAFLEWMMYSHPNAEKRIKMVKEWKRGKRK